MKKKQMLPIILILALLSQCSIIVGQTNYYKEASISGFISDFQKKLIVHYGSGTDSTTDVYLNSHCATDFSNIDFRLTDGTTSLNYWREEYTTGDKATFWIKLPSTSQNIRIYYGAGITTNSNGDNTFYFFDNCEGTMKWTESNSAYGDAEYSTSEKKYGTKSLKCTQANALNAYYVYKDISQNYFILEFWCKQPATNNYVQTKLMESGNNRMDILWDNLGALKYYQGTFINTGYTYSSNWEFHQLLCSSNTVIQWIRDGTIICSDCKASSWTTMTQIRIFEGSKDYNNDYAYYDDIRLRKYGAPPDFNFGSEQTTNQPPNAPTNSEPTNGATGIVLNPTLFWSAYSDPDGDPQQSIEVKVDEHSDLLTPEWLKSSGTGDSTIVNSSNGVFQNNLNSKTELQENTLYYWSVRTQDNKGAWSNWSTATSFTTGTFSPSTSNIAPAQGATGIILNPILEWSYSDPNSDPQQNSKIWVDNNSDFSSPEWRTGDAGAGPVTSLAVNSGNGIFANSCVGMTQLTQNTVFYFRVQVQDSSGRWSPYSSSTTFTTGVVPSPPTSCSATYVSDSEIDLSWIDNGGGGQGFQILRSVDLGAFTAFTTVPADSTGTIDSSITADHYYQYRVESYNGIGNSAYCETVTLCTSPLPPSSVQAVKEGSVITITWQDNSQSTNLHVIERKVGTGEWTSLSTSNNGTYQDTFQESWQSQTIVYRVKAQSCGPRFSGYAESNPITSNHPPLAEFSFWGAGGTAINFDASLSSDEDADPLTFTWIFGDGQIAEGKSVTHDYGSGGVWDVTLTVYDGKTQSSITHTVSISSSSSLRPSGGGETIDEAKDSTNQDITQKVLSFWNNIIQDSFKLFLVLIIVIFICFIAIKR